MATQEVLSGTITTGGGTLILNIDVEFSVQSKGNVSGSSDNVNRTKAMIEVQRNGNVIARKKLGQYIVDSDNTNNELFDLLELSNMGIVIDYPPAGSHTYSIHAWADQIAGSSDVTGFQPTVETITMVTTELKK